MSKSRIEKMFEIRKKEAIERAEEEEISLEEIDRKVRIELQSLYEYRIESMIIPGDEDKWNRLHNDVNIAIDEEKEIVDNKNMSMLIIVKYRRNRTPQEGNPQEG